MMNIKQTRILIANAYQYSVVGSRYHRERDASIIAPPPMPENIARNVYRWSLASVLDDGPPSKDAVLGTIDVKMRN